MNRRSFLSRCLAAAATVVARAYAPAAIPLAMPAVEPVVEEINLYMTDFGMVSMRTAQRVVDAFEMSLWYGVTTDPEIVRLNRWQRRQKRLARRSP
jgi:hypothetical protein